MSVTIKVKKQHIKQPRKRKQKSLLGTASNAMQSFGMCVGGGGVFGLTGLRLINLDLMKEIIIFQFDRNVISNLCKSSVIAFIFRYYVFFEPRPTGKVKEVITWVN